GITIGTRFPARKTSMGRVLLAAADAGYAPEVRAAGWAIVDQELEPGLRAVAAPVRDRTGEVVAAVNVSTSTARTSLEQLREVHLPALLRATAAIEHELHAPVTPGDRYPRGVS